MFRARDLLVRQRTQLLNALRGLLAEHGWIAPKGLFHASAMMAKIEDPSCPLPHSARDVFLVMIGSVKALDKRIHLLDREIAKRAREDETARRLMTIPGIGPITATALLALAPPPESFRKGRDFAAWLGLTPLQRSTGGKSRLGAITRMGERTLRRLLILGSAAVVLHASRRGAARIVARKEDGEKAAHAGDGRARQQDCAHRLGAACQRRSLSSSGRRRLKAAGARTSSVSDQGGYGTTVGETGPENQRFPPCFQSTLSGDLDPVRELPYGPAATRCTKAGQMAASDKVSANQKSLALKGASTDGKRTCALPHPIEVFETLEANGISPDTACLRLLFQNVEGASHSLPIALGRSRPSTAPSEVLRIAPPSCR